MKVRPVDIVERLEGSIEIDSPPIRLVLAIEKELSGHFELPMLQAAELAYALESRVAALISKRLLESDASGVPGRMVILGSNSDMLAGACHVLASDLEVVAQAKLQRKSVSPVLSRIRALSPTEFELFCSRVLSEIGAQSAFVTRQSNDQGIDFYGVLNVGALANLPSPFFKLSHNIELRFAGQAKHYPNTAIGTETVRSLIGAIALARTKTFSVDDDLFEKLALRPFSPLLAMLFSTGRFTSGARSLAESAGILVCSGEQLATFLTDKGVGFVSEGATSSFTLEKFSEWLSFKV